MDLCEALSLTCLEYRDAEISSLRRKLTAAHSRNYRLRKTAQRAAETLVVERRARLILHEILMSSIRRMDSLELGAQIANP